MAIPALHRFDNIMAMQDVTAVYKTVDGDFELGKFDIYFFLPSPDGFRSPRGVDRGRI
jgi:hypothetical protein